MCCINIKIVFIIVLEILIIICVSAKYRRIKRVVGAMDVDCGTQPRVASLQNSSTLQHLCGATILSPQFALTAAHCVPHEEDHYTLKLNNYCVTDNIPTPRADVLEIIRNQFYDPITKAHDIALLRIDLHLDDITLFTHTLLPTSSFGISGECKIYGYGYQDLTTMETSERLLAGLVRLVSLDECTRALGPHVAPRHDSGMICAIGDGVDACQGDSGSPLICSGGTIEGVSSYGMSCAVPGLPGVYLSVGAHLPWIHEVMSTIK